MVNLRRLDAFTKTRPDLQQKSVAGGIITLVAASTAAVLFIGQIALYIMGETKHSLTLSQSTSIPLIPLTQSKLATKVMSQQGRIPVTIYVTFPHVDCEKLDVVHDGAAMSTGELEKIHGSHTINKRKPTGSELTKAGISKAKRNEGCTVQGQLRPYIVAGSFSISLNALAWAEATQALSIGLRDPNGSFSNSLNQYNVSHYIHSIRFGHVFPKATDKPLEDLPHMIENEFHGIGVAQTQVKLVPTLTKGTFFDERMYQMSVVDITIQPQTLVAHGVQQLPGLTVSYDFTPLMVHQSDGREPFLVFLSSLISIVGGVFVTVGMLTGCLVHSAKAVAKKID